MIQKQFDTGIISLSILLPCYSTICQLSVTVNTVLLLRGMSIRKEGVALKGEEGRRWGGRGKRTLQSKSASFKTLEVIQGYNWPKFYMSIGSMCFCTNKQTEKKK